MSSAISSEIRISVVTPMFNRRDDVCESIRSSLSFIEEAGLPGEIVVVDDASTDDSVSRVTDAFKDEIERGTVRVITMSTNQGVTAAKQKGASASRGLWCIFMDSDDAFLPGVGETAAEALGEAPQACPIVFFRCLDARTGQLIGAPQQDLRELDTASLAQIGTPGECLPVVRREALLATPFEAQLRGFEVLTYLRLTRKFGPAIVAPVAVRSYQSDPSGDRLSTRRAIRRRGCSLAQGYFLILREFWQVLGSKRSGVLFRITYHGLNCLLFGRAKP